MENEWDKRLRQALAPTDEPALSLDQKIVEQVSARQECAAGKKRSFWDRDYPGMEGNIAVTVVGLLLCLLILSAFAYSRFSGIAGDELGFRASYKGDGVFEITVTNFSDKALKLEEHVKVMRWASGEEVKGDSGKIVYGNMKIGPHSEEVVTIDLSGGYDIAELEKPLPAGDWYYLVLTNDRFAFGQDWMCDIVFDQNASNGLFDQPAAEEKREEVIYPSVLRFEEWAWPTISEKVSVSYGEQKDGAISDHINIAGNTGDAVYSVADGIVVQTGFDVTYGNFILLDLGDGITVRYGHLQEILTEAGEQVDRGQEIGKLGATGRATGSNLFFAVYLEQEAINPLVE